MTGIGCGHGKAHRLWLPLTCPFGTSSPRGGEERGASGSLGFLLPDGERVARVRRMRGFQPRSVFLRPRSSAYLAISMPMAFSWPGLPPHLSLRGILSRGGRGKRGLVVRSVSFSPSGRRWRAGAG
ncbi:hypothetical protein XM25_20557 [Devosia sp. H5989]|nr:hypothetical protein XM25_20557 [Devosia sp. H5989]